MNDVNDCNVQQRKAYPVHMRGQWHVVFAVCYQCANDFAVCKGVGLWLVASSVCVVMKMADTEVASTDVLRGVLAGAPCDAGRVQLCECVEHDAVAVDAGRQERHCCQESLPPLARHPGTEALEP